MALLNMEYLLPPIVVAHESPIDPILKVLRMIVWGKIPLVWTYWGLGRHFYYEVGAL